MLDAAALLWAAMGLLVVLRLVVALSVAGPYGKSHAKSRYGAARRLLVVLRLVVALSMAEPNGTSHVEKVSRAAYKPPPVFALRGKCGEEFKLA